MAEMRSLLAFMDADDRARVLRFYERLFDEAGEEGEGALLKKLGSPVRQVLQVERKYREKIQAEEDMGFAGTANVKQAEPAAEELTEENPAEEEPAVEEPAVEEPAVEEPAEEEPAVEEPAVEEPAVEEPAEEEPAGEEPAVEELAEEEPAAEVFVAEEPAVEESFAETAEPAEEPAAFETEEMPLEESVKDDAAEEASEETGTVEKPFYADWFSEKSFAVAEPVRAETEETPAQDSTAEAEEVTYEQPAAEEKTAEAENEPREEASAGAGRVVAAVFVTIPMIVFVLLGIVLSVGFGLLGIVPGVGLGAAGGYFASYAFGGVTAFLPDILLLAGGSALCFCLALFFLWLGIWLAVGGARLTVRITAAVYRGILKRGGPAHG